MTISKLTLPIEIGKRYVRRDGLVVETKATRFGPDYLGIAHPDVKKQYHVYVKNGRVWNMEDSPRDLIADHIEAATEDKKGYKYARILRWIADGEEVQFQTFSGKWMIQDIATTLFEISVERFAPDRYRLKPRTIEVNGYTVPEPMTEAPAMYTNYWVPSPTSSNFAVRDTWINSEFDRNKLDRQIAHSTEAAAIAHAKAWLRID